jgi:hypothetical protein
MIAERLAVALCLSFVLSTVELIGTWQVVCVYALFLAWGWVTEQEVYDDLMAKVRQLHEHNKNKDTHNE